MTRHWSSTLVALLTIAGTTHGDDPFDPPASADPYATGSSPFGAGVDESSAAANPFGGEALDADAGATLTEEDQPDRSGPVRIRVELLEGARRTVSLPLRVKAVHNDGRNVGVEVEGTQKVSLVGIEAGMTTLAVTMEGGERGEVEVRVRADTREIDDLLKRLYPGAAIETHVVRSALLLRGTVERAEHVQQIVEIGEQFHPTVLNQLTVAGTPTSNGAASDPFGAPRPRYGDPFGRPSRGSAEYKLAVEKLNELLDRERWDDARRIAEQLATHRDGFNLEAYIQWRKMYGGSRTTGATEIPPGMRVVRMTAVRTAVPSSVRPGDAVDVATHVGPEVDTEQPDESVLTGVRVFAVNQGSSEEKVSVSLIVTPEQVGKIVVAQRRGPLRIVPRDSEASATAVADDVVAAGPNGDTSPAEPSVAAEIRELRDEVRSLRRDVGRILELLDDAEADDGLPAEEADDEGLGASTDDEDADREILGLGFRRVPTAEMPKETPYRGGMRVTEVVPGGRAERQGLRKDDILVGLGVWEIASPANYEYALTRLAEKGEERTRFYVLRKRGNGGWETLFGNFDLRSSAGTTTEGSKPAGTSLFAEPVRVRLGRMTKFLARSPVMAVVSRDGKRVSVAHTVEGEVSVLNLNPGKAIVEVWTGRDGKSRQVVDVVVEEA